MIRAEASPGTRGDYRFRVGERQTRSARSKRPKRRRAPAEGPALSLEISDFFPSADLFCMMIARTLSLALGVGMLFLPVSAGSAQIDLPATHPEPITIRILDGKGGAPLAHVHLQVVAGYDDRDLRLGLWSEEIVTDGQGRVSLPGSLKNFSLVAVWVAKHKLCAAHGRRTYMNLDNIRSEGLSTPNRCGTIMVAETPGVLNVFAKAHHKDLPPPPARPAMKPSAIMGRKPRAGPKGHIDLAAVSARLKSCPDTSCDPEGVLPRPVGTGATLRRSLNHADELLERGGDGEAEGLARLAEDVPRSVGLDGF
jgi:hypothetical protein